MSNFYDETFTWDSNSVEVRFGAWGLSDSQVGLLNPDVFINSIVRGTFTALLVHHLTGMNVRSLCPVDLGQETYADYDLNLVQIRYHSSGILSAAQDFTNKYKYSNSQGLTYKLRVYKALAESIAVHEIAHFSEHAKKGEEFQKRAARDISTHVWCKRKDEKYAMKHEYALLAARYPDIYDQLRQFHQLDGHNFIPHQDLIYRYAIAGQAVGRAFRHL